MKLSRFYILPFVSFVLFVLYLLSFIPGFTGRNGKLFSESFRNTRESAFLNPEKKDEVNFLTLSRAGRSISFEKQGDVWFATSEGNGSDYGTFFCDEEKLDSSLNTLKKIVKLSKISDSNKDLKAYSLDENQRLSVKYRTFDGETEFFLGSEDFSRNYRYVSMHSQGVWRTENIFTSFEDLDGRFSVSPYLFPRFLSVLKTSKEGIKLVTWEHSASGKIIPKGDDDFSSVLSLRHGPLISKDDEVVKELFSSIDSAGDSPSSFSSSSSSSSTSSARPSLFIRADYDGDISVSLSFFKVDEKSYVVRIQGGKLSSVHDDIQKSRADFFVSISEWTYNSLLELLQKL